MTKKVETRVDEDGFLITYNEGDVPCFVAETFPTPNPEGKLA